MKKSLPLCAAGLLALLPTLSMAQPPACAMPGQTMNRAWAEDFSEQWAAHWNALEIDAVVAHLADDSEMRSPLAVRLRGQTTINGKEAIRDYWNEAYGSLDNPDLQVRALSWDPAICRLNIWWTANTSSGQTRASEFMDFGADGKIVRGEAFYGQ